MKILILGSEGFIGQSLVRHFQQRNWQVNGADLTDPKNVLYTYYKISRINPEIHTLFTTNKFDVCINAAGSGSVPLSLTNPYNDFEANVTDTFKVLEAIRIYNKECLYVNFSSAAVYGNPKRLPVAETDDINPLSPYGWHKYYSELICREYNTLYSIRTVSIRPFSVYGPGLKKQLFWDIFQKSLKSNTIQLFGTGRESRDFISIHDVVASVASVIQNAPARGEVYNVATGDENTIKYVTETFCRFLDPTLKIQFTGAHRDGDPDNWRADITSIKNLGFKLKIDLVNGLENYAKWLKEK